MITEVMTKEVFLEMIEKSMDKKDVIIFTNRLETIKLLSIKKKNYAKSYSVIYPNDIFKNKDSIADLVKSHLIGIIICDNKFLNERLRKQFKEINKK